MGGAQAGAASRFARLRRLPLVGRAITGWGWAPRRALAPPPLGARPGFAVPPQLHRHDTDTQSLQLLSDPGALDTRRWGQPGARTPALARPLHPPTPAGPRVAVPAWPGAGGGDRAPAPAIGARLRAAAAAAAQLRAPGAQGSRRVSEAAATEAGERSQRQRGRPPWLPAPTALRPASAPVTFPGRLPRPRAPGPAPQAGARPSPAPPSRGAAGGRRRPGGRGRRGRLQLPPPPRSAPGPPGLPLPRRRAGARAPEAGGAAALASPGQERTGPALKGRSGGERGRWSWPRRSVRVLTQRPLPGRSPRRTQAPAHAGRPRLGRVPASGNSSRQPRRRQRKEGECSAWAARILLTALGAWGRPEVDAWHRRPDQGSACWDLDLDPLRLLGGAVAAPPSSSSMSLCLAVVTAKVRVRGCQRATAGAP